MDNAQKRSQFHQALTFRHATKSFDPDRKIPEEDFAFLLETARLSPSSFGFEPWRLIVVQDRELRERLKAVSWGAQGQLPTASHFVAMTVLRGEQLAPRGDYLARLLAEGKGLPADRQEGAKVRFEDFIDHDFHLDSPEKLTEWAARQGYIVLGNLLTAAAFLGIDSCPIEGFTQESVESELKGHGGYDPLTHAVVCLAAFGYRTQDPRPKVRRPLEQSVGWV